MKWKVLVPIVVVIIVLLIITGVIVWPSLIKEVPEEDEADGIVEKSEKLENGAEITYWYKEGKLEGPPYIKYSFEGKEYVGPFFLETIPALDWIKNNTEENAVFLCWYAYGGMIVGYSQRKSVVKTYSIELVSIVEDEVVLKNILERVKTLPPDWVEANETIRDVVQAFVTTDINETVAIMKKYGASYVFVMKQYNSSLYIYGAPGYMPGFVWNLKDIFKAAKLDFDDESIREETMIVRLLENRETGKLELIYSDPYVNIYRLET